MSTLLKGALQALEQLPEHASPGMNLCFVIIFESSSNCLPGVLSLTTGMVTDSQSISLATVLDVSLTALLNVCVLIAS